MEVVEVSVAVMEVYMDMENHIRTWEAGIKEIQRFIDAVEASSNFFFSKDQATVEDFIVGPRGSSGYLYPVYQIKSFL